MKKLSVLIKRGILLNILILLWNLLCNNYVFINDFNNNEEVLVFDEYVNSYPSVRSGSLIFNDYHKINVNGEVDTNKVGEYKVVYNYTMNDKEYHLVKTVNVIDREIPVIKVDEETEIIKACPNGKILTKSVSATDNYDGDITSSIKALDDHLEVVDSSGNKGSLNIAVTKEDTEKPVITLKGDSKMYLLIDSKFEDPGFTAIDNCDDDLTSDVKVSGTVTTSKKGTYTLTYEVSDQTGNKASVKREVIVIKKNDIVYPTGKTIYLTFDDGPGAYTKKLLDILDKYNVKATFFVTNQYPSYQYLIKEEAKRGHTVAIHTYSHNYNIYKSTTAYFNDLNKMNDIIKKQTGNYSYLVRFPGGSSNTVSRSYAKGIMKTLSNELTNRGYVYFDWNVCGEDAGSCAKSGSSSCVKNTVIKYMNGKYLNILLHDIKGYTVNAMEDIIKAGLSKGYTFMGLSQNSPTFHQKIAN